MINSLIQLFMVRQARYPRAGAARATGVRRACGRIRTYAYTPGRPLRARCARYARAALSPSLSCLYKEKKNKEIVMARVKAAVEATVAIVNRAEAA